MSKIVDINESTVSRLRQRCVEEELDASIERKPREREKSRVLNVDGKAHLITTLCSNLLAVKANTLDVEAVERPND